jgi:hypothetical protein
MVLFLTGVFAVRLIGTCLMMVFAIANGVTFKQLSSAAAHAPRNSELREVRIAAAVC